MLDHANLHRIAASIARRDEDLYQQIWVRYLHQHPRTCTGAWALARWTRDDEWRKARRTIPLALDVPHVLAMDDLLDIRAAIRGDADQVAFLIWYEGQTECDRKRQGRLPSRLRTRAHRTRHYLRAKYRQAA